MTTNATRPRTLPPAVAAGLGAFAGMYSCALSMTTLSMWFAPILGLGIAFVVFKLLSRAQPPGSATTEPAATSEAAQELTQAAVAPVSRSRPWLYALIAWLVCIAVGGGIAWDSVKMLPPGDPLRQHPFVAVGLWAGAIFGVPVGFVVWLVSWLEKRRADRARI